MTTTRLRLGELLLARGLCSREALREAWEQKVLYGDRLGTNLLAIGALDEETLARALGEQHGVLSGHGEAIAPHDDALPLIQRPLAVRRLIVPHHVEGRQLYLMMRDPHDAAAIDEAAFASGLRIVPVVVPEARIWRLIEETYKGIVSMRPVPLDGAVRARAAEASPVAANDAAHELTSEAEFQALYASAHGAVASQPPISPAEELEHTEEILELVDLASQPPAEVPDDTPLSFAEADALLRTATDRDAIARIVLRAAHGTFARACLLTIYADRIAGWTGIGAGFDDASIRRIALSRGDKSVFSLVADSRAHHLGPLTRVAAHGAWVKATGRQIPRSLAVFPILVRARPVNLLVVDNGHDQHVSGDVGEVLILAQQIARSYETLLTQTTS